MNDDQPIAVELAGYLGSAVGVGEAARRYVRALRSAGAQVHALDVPLPGRDRVQTAELDDPGPDVSAAYEILCLNPEQMVSYLDDRRPPRERRRTIGVWSWEVGVVPDGWKQASRRLDEIWTYSAFAARLIGEGIQAQVRCVPLPVWAPIPARTHPPILPEGFRVLVMFDYLSTLERKNPLGAMEAYKRAFSPHEGSVLMVKSVNGQHRREQRARIAAAAEGRPDITLIDETISGEERDTLLSACDCVLSLHRSEGYGLPLAEAMAIGKPVVATAFGGNMEFMDEHSSYPVVWTPAPVGEGVEHYPPDAQWAEPNIEHAAELLRQTRYDPDTTRERTARGRCEVERRLAPGAVGAEMIARMRGLGEPRRGGSLAARMRRLAHARS